MFWLQVKNLFGQLGVEFTVVELNQIENGPALQDALEVISKQRTVPNVFINKTHLGGCDATERAHRENRLAAMLRAGEEEVTAGHPELESYDYDLVVIGGGSGGLAASKEAADLGAKVAVLDFVKPSEKGTTWGHNIEDANKFGWDVNAESAKHQWDAMRDAIQDHIGGLNWGYRVSLRTKEVTYINSMGEFVGPHKLKCTNRKGKSEEITAKFFIVATGCRPKYPNMPGVKEFGITSDDLFSLPYCPGKTLVIGASYVSLECAGFLAALGLDVTVMVRSILLRGFDQQMAEMIGDHMTKHNIKFIRPCVPTKVEKIKDGEPGTLRVTATMQKDGSEIVGEYNTVMFAVGREPCTKSLGLDMVGVKVNTRNGFILVNEEEQTACPYVYAIGDVIDGKPELTPVAIQAGRLLAKRVFGASKVKWACCDAESVVQMDYTNVATTVFTPLEYGAIGLSEEDAVKEYGVSSIEVYHTYFDPLEWTVPHRDENTCYAKLICLAAQKLRVVGLHVLSPNAGEITQGFALGMKLGATKADFDNLVGIHPTCAEIFTGLTKTKRSGVEVAASAC
ncbi:hypothetical protein NP493_135g04020 [Ridgeia piscesae]|uniref:thioredoxin-disulfide reductase (NADPH) n=1 Tax=Ridgeia piscesae TaxID=27915 RepID=A0AAD9P557_RIDPI|nr:hypothetical protein NP493_135g04020 [Ridgeia piscesae]